MGRPFILVTAALAYGGLARAACPIDRADVKVGRDNAARSFDTTRPNATTIEQIRALPAPKTALPARGPGPENTVYRVSGRLRSVEALPDSTYALVIADEKGNTIVAKAASPTCAAGSRWLDQIRDARLAIDEAVAPSPAVKKIDLAATVDGVGLFEAEKDEDARRNQAPNAFELQPVLAVDITGVTEPAPNAAAKDPKSGPGADTSKQQPSPRSADDRLFWIVFWIMTALYALGLAGTIARLRADSGWSLTGALCEDNKPSSSRLIAFLGSVVLLAIYIGLSYIASWRLVHNQALPDMNGFLITGLTLFAPYAANQVRAMTSSVLPTPAAAVPAGPGAAIRTIVVTPNPCKAGTTVQLTATGSGLDPGASVTLTTPNGTTPVSAVVAPTQAQFSAALPASAGPYLAVVTITNPGGSAAMGSVQVQP